MATGPELGLEGPGLGEFSQWLSSEVALRSRRRLLRTGSSSSPLLIASLLLMLHIAKRIVLSKALSTSRSEQNIEALYQMAKLFGAPTWASPLAGRPHCPLRPRPLASAASSSWCSYTAPKMC